MCESTFYIVMVWIGIIFLGLFIIGLLSIVGEFIYNLFKIVSSSSENGGFASKRYVKGVIEELLKDVERDINVLRGDNITASAYGVLDNSIRGNRVAIEELQYRIGELDKKYRAIIKGKLKGKNNEEKTK